MSRTGCGRRRRRAFIPWRCYSRSGRVEGFDLGFVLLGDRAALELHRRRQLLAPRLPVGREDPELLDLLDPGELRVGLLYPGPDRFDHRLLLGQLLEPRCLEAALL